MRVLGSESNPGNVIRTDLSQFGSLKFAVTLLIIFCKLQSPEDFKIRTMIFPRLFVFLQLKDIFLKVYAYVELKLKVL